MSTVPEGAVCAQHPQARAAIICSRCGGFACVECTHFAADGQHFCATCRGHVALDQPLATRGSRLAAHFIDVFAVLIPAGVLAAAGGVLMALLKDEETAQVLIGLGLLGGLAVGVGAQIWAQLHWGQSLGKRLMRIKVVRLSGAPIELWRLILLRNLALHAANQVCGILGLIDVLLIFSANQRCLHDYLADSKVISVANEQ